MNVSDIFANQPLIAAFIAWFLAQVVKVPVEYVRTREWNWALLLSTGGMPSSHSALVSALAHGIGLWYGFNTPVYAISFVVAVVVIYDATGIRRQAGKHAAMINAIINDLTAGHPIRDSHQQQLKEILGHTWLEAIGGIVWGILIVSILWMLWG